MQHIIFRLVTIIVISAISFTASAQQDSMRLDSARWEYRQQSRLRKTDSLKAHIHFDKQAQLFDRKALRFDSLNRNMKVRLQDSLHFKQKVFVRMDSLRRLQKIRTDSVYRKSMTQLRSKLAAQEKLRAEDFRKLATLKNLDSMQLRLHLQQLKLDMKLRDSVKQSKMKAREISMTMPVKTGDRILINDIGRKAIVKTSSDQQLRVTANIRYQADNDLSDREWFEKISLQVSNTDSGLVIRQVSKAAGEKKGAIDFKNIDVAAVKAADEYNTRNNSRATITVYVPAGISVNIVSSYADVRIDNNMKGLRVQINNASLNMQGAEKAVITGRYAGITAATIKEAQLDLLNCNFTADDINKLDIISSNSKVNFSRSVNVKLKSTGDQYRIEQVSELKGNKNFGKLSIDHLDNNMVLSGSNADVNINAVASTASLVQIDNKYADVRVPVNMLTAYTVSVGGTNTRLFTASAGQVYGKADSARTVVNYVATAGNTSNGYTKLDIKCSNCNVDLKK